MSVNKYGYSGLIGLFTQYAGINAKYLYVSGNQRATLDIPNCTSYITTTTSGPIAANTTMSPTFSPLKTFTTTVNMQEDSISGIESGDSKDQIILVLVIICGVLFCIICIGIVLFLWHRNKKNNGDVDTETAIDSSNQAQLTIIDSDSAYNSSPGVGKDKDENHEDSEDLFKHKGSTDIQQHRETEGKTPHGNDTPGETEGAGEHHVGSV